MVVEMILGSEAGVAWARQRTKSHRDIHEHRAGLKDTGLVGSATSRLPPANLSSFA